MVYSIINFQHIMQWKNLDYTISLSYLIIPQGSGLYNFKILHSLQQIITTRLIIKINAITNSINYRNRRRRWAWRWSSSTGVPIFHLFTNCWDLTGISHPTLGVLFFPLSPSSRKAATHTHNQKSSSSQLVSQSRVTTLSQTGYPNSHK